MYRYFVMGNILKLQLAKRSLLNDGTIDDAINYVTELAPGVAITIMYGTLSQHDFHLTVLERFGVNVVICDVVSQITILQNRYYIPNEISVKSDIFGRYTAELLRTYGMILALQADHPNITASEIHHILVSMNIINTFDNAFQVCYDEDRYYGVDLYGTQIDISDDLKSANHIGRVYQTDTSEYLYTEVYNGMSLHEYLEVMEHFNLTKGDCVIDTHLEMFNYMHTHSNFWVNGSVLYDVLIRVKLRGTFYTSFGTTLLHDNAGIILNEPSHSWFMLQGFTMFGDTRLKGIS